MTANFSGSVALITGGTSGIGLATAHALHADGHAVILTGRSSETIAAAKATLPEDVLVLQADVRSADDAQSVADAIRDRFGGLDFAFLNAGVAQMGPIESVDEAACDRMFAVNTGGAILALRKILPLIRPGGSVVFTSGHGVSKGTTNWSVPTATKGALSGLLRSPSVSIPSAPGQSTRLRSTSLACQSRQPRASGRAWLLRSPWGGSDWPRTSEAS